MNRPMCVGVISQKAPLFLCPAVEVDQFINIGSESVHVPLIGRSGVMEVLPLPDQVGIRVISARRRNKQVSKIGHRYC
jgi:hypothetical protein